MASVMVEQMDVELTFEEQPAHAEGYRALKMMHELRSQMEQRNELPQRNPIEGVSPGKYRDVFNLVDDNELQGMLMMFNFLHSCGDNELVHHTSEDATVDNLLCLLDDLRNYIRIRMHPVQDLYLSTAPFEESDSAYDLRIQLGDARLRGAIMVFNLLHPEEVKIAQGSPVSFTLFYGPPPRAAPRLAGSNRSSPQSAPRGLRGSGASSSATPHRAARTTPARSPAPRTTPAAANPPAARALFTS